MEAPPARIEKALANVDGVLDRLRDAASANADFANEGPLRRDELSQLGSSTTTLMRELYSKGADNANSEPEDRVTTSFDKLQDAVPVLNQSVDDQTALAAKVREARGDVAQIREALYGGPIKTWLRGLFKFDETQLAEWHGELQAVARPLALGTTQFLGSFLVQMLVGIGVMVVALYYFLADGPEMIDQLRKLTPLDNRYEAQLLDEFGQLTRAILVAMLLSAFAQGASVDRLCTGRVRQHLSAFGADDGVRHRAVHRRDSDLGLVCCMAGVARRSTPGGDRAGGLRHRAGHGRRQPDQTLGLARSLEFTSVTWPVERARRRAGLGHDRHRRRTDGRGDSTNTARHGSYRTDGHGKPSRHRAIAHDIDDRQPFA